MLTMLGLLQRYEVEQRSSCLQSPCISALCVVRTVLSHCSNSWSLCITVQRCEGSHPRDRTWLGAAPKWFILSSTLHSFANKLFRLKNIFLRVHITHAYTITRNRVSVKFGHLHGMKYLRNCGNKHRYSGNQRSEKLRQYVKTFRSEGRQE